MIKLYFFRLNSPEVWYTIQPAKAYRYGGQDVAQCNCDLLNSVRDIMTTPEGQTLKHICQNFRVEHDAMLKAAKNAVVGYFESSCQETIAP
jgi:hypothetical protein